MAMLVFELFLFFLPIPIFPNTTNSFQLDGKIFIASVKSGTKCEFDLTKLATTSASVV